jgi:splicing factor U2AF subunit
MTGATMAPGMMGMGMMPAMGGNDPMTKKARELYIGNLPDGVPEAQLMAFLNAALCQAGQNTQPGMPIVSVRCNGRFAFAEFRTTEETTMALNLNGIILVGHALNVGRPSAYTGPPTQHIRWDQLMAQKIAENPQLAEEAIGLAPGGAGAVAGAGAGHSCAGDPTTKVCRELYIGNMPDGITELQMCEFLNAEMIRAGWHNSAMPGNPIIQARINGRFAFIEFRSVEETDKGLQLNGVNFAGCSLRVGRPKAYTGPPGSQPPAGTLFNAAPTGPKQTPTTCLQLSKMVTLEELKDEEEYADIVEDIEGEIMPR